MRCISIGAIILILSSLIQAAVAETWDCSFKILSHSDKGMAGKSRIEISNGVLEWLLPTPFGGREWAKFPYKIVDDNDTGTVSISGGAHVDSKVGPIVGASIIALNKKSGNVRMGSVTVEGTDDRLSGQCRKK